MFNNRGYTPIRADKIEEVKRELEEFVKDKYGITKPTINEKLNYIFVKRRKHFDREALEKGLSLKELILILHPDKVTIEQMSPEWERKNTSDFMSYVWPVIKNTKMSIFRFRRWSGEEEGVNLFPLKLKTEIGTVWLYCNIQNDKDWNQYEMMLARISLGIQKNLERAGDILEMRPEERKRKMQETVEYIVKKNKARKERAMKKAKTWDGKPIYSDIDFTGVNLKDTLGKKEGK